LRWPDVNLFRDARDVANALLFNRARVGFFGVVGFFSATATSSRIAWHRYAV
jgi:hypothetical protein